MRQLAATLLMLIAFSALAATDADLVATGRAALDRGDIDQAIGQLERAVARIPSDSEAHYHLGRPYVRKGNKAGMSLVKKAKAIAKLSTTHC